MKKIIRHQKNNLMRNTILLRSMFFLFFLCSTVACGQKVVILKDSVKYNSDQYVLEEIKIDSRVKHATLIQNQIQDANDIFNKPNFKTAEERLKAKKDTLTKLIKNDELRQANYGFEQYTILFQNDKILNLSIHLQSFGSPFEVYKYFAFDLANGKKIDSSYFKDKDKLKKQIQSKLKEQAKAIKLTDKDLSSFILKTDAKNKITGITFIVYDKEKYRNSGYEEFEVDFLWSEINKFLEPDFSNFFNNN